MKPHSQELLDDYKGKDIFLRGDEFIGKGFRQGEKIMFELDHDNRGNPQAVSLQELPHSRYIGVVNCHLLWSRIFVFSEDSQFAEASKGFRITFLCRKSDSFTVELWS